MTDILKHLNTIIDNSWEFLNLYEGSELENQHKCKDKDYASEIEDFAFVLVFRTFPFTRPIRHHAVEKYLDLLNQNT